MPTPKTQPAHDTPADTTAAVDTFLSTLPDADRARIERLRVLMLALDPAVREGIKWNAPSFRTSEYFATTHLRGKDGVSLILHLGAKARALPAGGVAIDDPQRLLKWLGADRAQVEGATLARWDEIEAPLASVLRQWIAFV